MWSGSWYRVRAAQSLGFALAITTLYGVTAPRGPGTHSSSCSCDLFHQRSNVESVTAYILNQAEHHRKISYQEEIREIFKHHRVAFDERYVWD
jgi:hypothetical protein